MTQASNLAVYQMILKILKTWADEKTERRSTIMDAELPKKEDVSRENSYKPKQANELSNLSVFSSRTIQEMPGNENHNNHQDDNESGISPLLPLPKYNVQILEPIIAPDHTANQSDKNIKSRASIIDLQTNFSKGRAPCQKVTFAKKVSSSKEIGKRE